MILKKLITEQKNILNDTAISFYSFVTINPLDGGVWREVTSKIINKKVRYKNHNFRTRKFFIEGTFGKFNTNSMY